MTLEHSPTSLRRREPIPAAARRRLLPGHCVYCGDFATCIDHVVPVAQGGTSIIENLAPACRSCNEEKLDWQPWQWRASREEMGWPWPPESRSAAFLRLLGEELERRGMTWTDLAP